MTAMLPMSGATESSGDPTTFYEYSLETWGRTASSVHVRLSLRLRMRDFGNYYSFRIAHECRVNGTYAYADVKATRAFWGHQWEGLFVADWYDWGTFGWDPGSPDYDGSAWHGPFVVFDADVPMAPGASRLSVVPCITQPPITGLGAWDDVFGPNDQDVTNWAGASGWWRPFGEDEQVGTYAGRPCPQDGCWLNNRGLLELGGCDVGTFALPDAPTSLSVSPASVDVAAQASTRLSVTWARARFAERYEVRLDGELVATTSGTSASAVPARARSLGMSGGDRASFQVRSLGSGGGASAWSHGASASYFERPTRAPSSVVVSGSGRPGHVASRGESARVSWPRPEDGSWPVTSYRVVLDGETLSELPASGASAVPGGLSTQVTFPARPAGSSGTLEVRVYCRSGEVFRADGTRASCEVAWDAPEVSVYDGERWLSGPLSVYDGTRWRASLGASAMGSVWRSQ